MKRPLLLLGLTVASPALAAETFPTTMGQTGLINMPDGQVAADGTWRMGVGYLKPYNTLWTSVTVLPRFEFSARYTRVESISTSDYGDYWTDYGDYKDKAFDTKLSIFEETALLPAIAVGTQDFTGTRLFSGQFVAITKHIDDFELTLGYGSERLKGAFGGARYRPSWAPGWSVAAEYDNTAYDTDKFTPYLERNQRQGGTTYGIEYRWGWLGAQVINQGNKNGANLFISIPLGEREFIPKIHEPAPDTAPVPRVPSSEWEPSPNDHSAQLILALQEQGFKNIRLRSNGDTLELSFTQNRIRHVGRAVGRAARTAILKGPADVRVLKITYTERDLPLLTYTFQDTQKLAAFFGGQISEAELRPFVLVEPTRPGEYAYLGDEPEFVPDFKNDAAESTSKMAVTVGEGEILRLEREEPFLESWRITPFNLSMYLNDPSGVFHYNLFAAANYDKRLAPGLFVTSSIRATYLEDVSEVTQPSNSLLPHVRSDIADYSRHGPVKLDTLLLNQYFKPSGRFYGRLSAGLYEEMFGGVGGQLLYLPDSNWATDLSFDWLRQREVGGNLKFRDYETISALAAIHYRIPSLGLTATARAGRFLAKDEGVRYELTRRFRSGVEYGAWYTVTNGNDVTSPGTPADPYHDKGLFLSIPLASMLTRDTQAQPDMSISPWTRDVGQMVRSPGDLYRLLEKRLLMHSDESDPLLELGH